MNILFINGSPNTLYFLFQGATPEQWMLEAGEYTMKRFAGLMEWNMAEWQQMAIKHQNCSKHNMRKA